MLPALGSHPCSSICLKTCQPHSALHLAHLPSSLISQLVSATGPDLVVYTQTLQLADLFIPVGNKTGDLDWQPGGSHQGGEMG